MPNPHPSIPSTANLTDLASPRPPTPSFERKEPKKPDYKSLSDTQHNQSEKAHHRPRSRHIIFKRNTSIPNPT
ncbi:hypothetical protein NEOLEDRAFT_1128992 [Neolentinus lepideus HHB14362 ss-1]|uniref:Uncharacterized protein n=1 Tax=Neolentinus lepideus HHB14362 ss-1 TaxID=1314782 RepID=A0A165UVW9_9AGAM|nr:hypothetical protein NEOLEDRAFT_1128992 [Neolentinus lepideus HHB14362 ss-1]